MRGSEPNRGTGDSADLPGPRPLARTVRSTGEAASERPSSKSSLERARGPIFGLLLLGASSACSGDAATAGAWSGTVDTLASGHVVVQNPMVGLWGPGEAWRVEEELRIGRVDGDGPDVFGSINSIEVDAHGRIWVLDGQAQELRLFSPAGEHVRTVGRRGEGPEEFAQAVRAEVGPDGNLWVMDPQNNRLSVIDSTGTFLGSHRALGGFIFLPWPGRFDDEGFYYSPVPRAGGASFEIALLRSDPAFASSDTVLVPADPVERESFEHRTGSGGFIRAAVPFQGGLRWRLSPSGTLLAMLTDEYRIFEVDRNGDTIRTVRRDHTPLPVTAADRERAEESMEWFTRQGGRWDPGRLPRVKAATRDFAMDDEGNLWVALVTPDDRNLDYDIFDPDGRFLGTIELPFAPVGHLIVREGTLHAVVRDEFDVQYVVRGRIEKPLR